MSFRALVINPWVVDFKLYDEWMHPVGLYFLVALLRRGGADVRYVNCLDRPENAAARPNGTGSFPARAFPKPALYKNVKRRYKLYGIPEDELASLLVSFPAPDAVFVGSSMTYWLPGLAETFRLVKSVHPRALVIVGGTSAQLIPAAVQNACPGAHLFRGTLFDQPAIRTSGIPFLSSLPTLTPADSLVPAFELLAHPRHGPALASLGCPYSCSYCASPILHRGYGSRPPTVVSEELAFLQERFGVENFAWYDDALLYDCGRHFLDLSRAMKQGGLPVSFHAPNGLHVRWITPEVLDAMKHAGFRTLRFGYESGAAAFRRDTGGKASEHDLTAAVRLARRSGFTGHDIGVYLMAGLPGQTPADIAAEIEFVVSLSVKAKPVLLSPVPGTPLFERYAATYPILRETPLSHNDTFFITQLPGWDAESVQQVMDLAKAKNAAAV
jgi:hypothetical protein